ncbi:hypothetical protein HPB50_012377 [Hyalomma asiaticum]|uniref:Uncharacterized protein n=1 Tax=Hyalomma asiaticum TaxID=266040 RepID=A0ACB7SQF3_HYAAI|nr:hypothetical protein HPB50_012377 [Hyalomma asiaticum]
MDLSAYARGLDKPARLRYLEKVRLCGDVDPLELQDAELQRDVEVLPRVEFTDIKDYLVHATSFVSREQLKAYKSMDGHNYLTSGWVQQPGVKVLPDSTIVVVGKVCTDRTNAWLPPSVRFLEGKEASQVSFASSTMRKRQMGGEEPLRKRQRRRNIEKPTNEEWASFLSSCHASGCRPALLSLEENFAKDYVPVATKFPTAALGNLQGDDVPATWENVEAHCCRIAGTLSLEKEVAEEIEKETRQQSKSSKWFAFRAGRITASNAKAVCRTSVTTPSRSLVKRVCYPEATQFWFQIALAFPLTLTNFAFTFAVTGHILIIHRQHENDKKKKTLRKERKEDHNNDPAPWRKDAWHRQAPPPPHYG